MFREIGDRSGEAEALSGLASVSLATGQPAHARAHYAMALDLASQIGDQYEKARAADGLARACQAVGDAAQASCRWQEALALYTGLGAPEADEVRARLMSPAEVTYPERR